MTQVARVKLASTVSLGHGVNDLTLDIDSPYIESMKLTDYGVQVRVQGKSKPRLVPSSNVLMLVLDVAEDKQMSIDQPEKRGRGRPPKFRAGKDG